jgi:single-stranded-DNA-specific exonuclease
MDLSPAFKQALASTAESLTKLESPQVITHLDADGLTSGAIIYKTLELLRKKPKILALRQLDPGTINQIPEKNFVLVDFGSGQLPELQAKGPGVIIDHHEPMGRAPEGIAHLNAIEQGLEGSREISASGLAYLVSRELVNEPSFIPLALVGAVGDVQAHDGFVGLNREILATGISAGVVQARHGLPFFGRETKPLEVFLSYAADPYLPGLTGSLAACRKFLEDAGVDPSSPYNTLTPPEVSRLVTALHQHAIQTGLESWKLKRLVSEFYIFPQEKEGRETRDATEFATLLNACGRNDEWQTAVDICLGNREDAYLRAKTLLNQHRENLKRGLQELVEGGAKPVGGNVQVFFSPTTKPTIIGVVIGMALGGRLVDPTRVVIGAAPQDEQLKISARGTPELVRAGLNLSSAIRAAASAVGGVGGGHNIAAGATIPAGKLDEFAEKLDAEILTQLKN